MIAQVPSLFPALRIRRVQPAQQFWAAFLSEAASRQTRQAAMTIFVLVDRNRRLRTLSLQELRAGRYVPASDAWEALQPFDATLVERFIMDIN